MKRTILLFLCCFAGMGLVRGQTDESKTALVLIDIQAFYFDTTRAPLAGREEASLQAAKMLDEAGFSDTVIVLSNNLDELLLWLKK